METFCDDLRHAREQRDITLATIATVTKVSPRYLRALETGHFQDLPGGVFRKGILRGYLTAIGVEPTPWVERFDSLLATASAVPPITPAALDEFTASIRRNRPPSTPVSRLRWVGLFVMLLVLAALCSFIWIFALRGHVAL